MDFWDDLFDRIKYLRAVISAGLALVIALLVQSWWLALAALGLFLLLTANTWIWWLPGLRSRKKVFDIPLEGGRRNREGRKPSSPPRGD